MRRKNMRYGLGLAIVLLGVFTLAMPLLSASSGDAATGHMH
jgi:hypothetical protein